MGDSWRPLNKLLGIAPNEALASSGATSATVRAEHPLYLADMDHLPASLFRLRAALIADDRHWAYLPPLPAPGTSRDHSGLTNLLGVTALGKLLAFGVSP